MYGDSTITKHCFDSCCWDRQFLNTARHRIQHRVCELMKHTKFNTRSIRKKKTKSNVSSHPIPSTDSYKNIPFWFPWYRHHCTTLYIDIIYLRDTISDCVAFITLFPSNLLQYRRWQFQESSTSWPALYPDRSSHPWTFAWMRFAPLYNEEHP